jgi:hypothetical protein
MVSVRSRNYATVSRHTYSAPGPSNRANQDLVTVWTKVSSIHRWESVGCTVVPTKGTTYQCP